MAQVLIYKDGEVVQTYDSQEEYDQAVAEYGPAPDDYRVVVQGSEEAPAVNVIDSFAQFYGGDIRNLYKNRDKVKERLQAGDKEARKAFSLIQAIDAAIKSKQGENINLEELKNFNPQAYEYFQQGTKLDEYRSELDRQGDPSTRQVLFPEASRRVDQGSGALSVGLGATKDILNAPGRALRTGASIVGVPGMDQGLTPLQTLAMPSKYKSGSQEMFDEMAGFTGLAGGVTKRVATPAIRFGSQFAGSASKPLSVLGQTAAKVGGGMPQDIIRRGITATEKTPALRQLARIAPEAGLDVGYEATRPEDEEGAPIASLVGSGLGFGLTRYGGDAIDRVTRINRKPDVPRGTDLFNEIRPVSGAYNQPREFQDILAEVQQNAGGRIKKLSAERAEDFKKVDDLMQYAPKGMYSPKSYIGDARRFTNLNRSQRDLAMDTKRLLLEDADVRNADFPPMNKLAEMRSQIGRMMTNTSDKETKSVYDALFKDIASTMDSRVETANKFTRDIAERYSDAIPGARLGGSFKFQKTAQDVSEAGEATQRINKAYTEMRDIFQSLENMPQIKSGERSIRSLKKVDSFINQIANSRVNYNLKQSTFDRFLADFESLAKYSENREAVDYISDAIMSKVDSPNFWDTMIDARNRERIYDIAKDLTKEALINGTGITALREALQSATRDAPMFGETVVPAYAPWEGE